MTVSVVYQNGVFRPVAPVQLEDGARGEVIVESPRRYWSPQDVAQALQKIAAMPSQGAGDFSGEDHDSILYGKDGAW